MLQELWNNLAAIGLSGTIEEREAIKIRVLNQLIVVLLATASILSLILAIVTGDFYLVLPHLISLIMGLVALTFHYYQFFYLVRHFACFIFPIWVGIIIINLQENSNGEAILYLITSLLAFIQYEGQVKYKIICLIWNTTLAISSLFYLISFAPIHLNPYGFMVLVTGLIVNISFLITFYQNDIQKIAKQKNKLVKQLQLKNNELERFAYITSHDLKEPVKNIEGFSSLLQNKLGKEGATDNVELANMINYSAKRMSTLIDSILKFSKLEKDDLQFESVDLNTIVQQFKNSHSHLLKNRKAVIQYDNLPTVKGNKIYFSLLFQNLIENGIKYNESKIPSIKIFAYQDKKNTHLVIGDNGIGISKDYETYIFEPFRRLHNRSKYEGTGLGLSICKKIVENHSGKIWVESDASGSQFNILFPSVAELV